MTSKKTRWQSEPDLTLQEAADLLGVHYMTAYRYVRTGRLQPRRRALARATRRPRQDRGRGAGRDNDRAGAEGTMRRLTSLLVRVTRPKRGDSSRPHWVPLTAPRTSTSTCSVPRCGVGDDWAAGRLDVADEHRAVVMYRLIGRLGPLFARRGTAAPSCSAHPWATPMGSLPRSSRIHCGRGFSITDLGANTPAASWANSIAGTQRIVRVGVVVSTPIDDALVAETSHIKTHHHGPVVLGVAIRDQDHAIALGGDIWTTSREAVDHFDATT